MASFLRDHNQAITLVLMIGSIFCLIAGYWGERVHARKTRPKSAAFETKHQLREVFSARLIIFFNALFIVLVLISGWMIFRSVPDDLEDSVVWNIVGTISVSAICLAYVRSAGRDRDYYKRSDFKAAALAVALFAAAYIFYMWKRQAFVALLICDGAFASAMLILLMSKKPLSKKARHFWDRLCQLGVIGVFLLIVWVGLLRFVL